MLDIAIIRLPGTITQSPPAAPALLKAAIVQAGFTCRTFDFNIEFYHLDHENLNELENYFLTGLNADKVKDPARELINVWARQIIELNPKFIGISVFTFQNHISTKLFCEYIKKFSNIKIILGGQGLVNNGILGPQGFAKELKEQGLADFYIKSEGERSLVELLKGNEAAPGINSDSFDQLTDLDSLPIPDYSDYKFKLYKHLYLPVTASRGCVRACSFCDIHNHWKYQYRSGHSVADEIINLYKKYGISDFYFTDSLINGSLKEFRIFCKKMTKFNIENNANIKYTGQYIVRSSNLLDEDYWSNLSSSGATRLAIGVETGSDTVREHMNKKFTNADLDYTMEMLHKYNITCQFLIIIGYPTETEDDFNQTLGMFKTYQSLANKIIVDITFGSTLGILPGTPLFEHAHNYQIELDSHENNWIAIDNPTLTLTERIRRRKVAKDYVKSLGYKLDDDTGENLLSMLEENMPRFDKLNKIKKLIKIRESTKNAPTL